ncbi:MAG: ATP-binding cassette domain-containing protein [Alphaproteobacteria bacterium]
MVRLEDVAKRFGAVTAVDDASFAVERGQFLTILGPSGSGKTTVLRLIAGFFGAECRPHLRPRSIEAAHGWTKRAGTALPAT